MLKASGDDCSTKQRRRTTREPQASNLFGRSLDVVGAATQDRVNGG
jgi:hypothetical protein